MGRSVSYPSNTTALAFDHVDWDDYGDVDDAIDDFRRAVKHLWPSARTADDWLGREDHVLAINGHAQFGMSEYGGIVAYWMVPRDDGYGTVSPLARAWCERAAPKFEEVFGSLNMVGRFSNGGAVYARKDGRPVGPDQFDTSPITIGGLLTDG